MGSNAQGHLNRCAGASAPRASRPIDPHCREACAGVNAAFCEGHIARQNACRFAASNAASDRVQNGVHDLRMIGHSDMAEARRQIAGSQEHAIDTVDAGDCFQGIQTSLRFDLDEQTDFLIRLGCVVTHASKLRGPSQSGDSADRSGRITNGGNRSSGFSGRLDIRNHQRLHPDVEKSLDQDRIVA